MFSCKLLVTYSVFNYFVFDRIHCVDFYYSVSFFIQIMIIRDGWVAGFLDRGGGGGFGASNNI